MKRKEKRSPKRKKNTFLLLLLSLSLLTLSFSPRPSPRVSPPFRYTPMSDVEEINPRKARGAQGGGATKLDSRISFAMMGWDAIDFVVVLLSFPPFSRSFRSQSSRLRERAPHKDRGTHALKSLVAPAARGETHSAAKLTLKGEKKRMLNQSINQKQATPRRLRATLASSTPSRPSWTPSWACRLVLSRRCRSR